MKAALPVAVALAACAHPRQLVPAADAPTVAGHPRVAEETVSGVHLQVDSAAWTGGRVSDVLSPVKVTLRNDSEHPLRIAYGAFTLGRPNGFRLQALPPFQVAAQSAAAVAPAYAWTGFSIAPWHARWYGGRFPVWSGLAFDAPYGPAYGGWPAALPDQDVLRHALPEGVLDPGGKLEGFLYFPDQPRGTALELLAALTDAATGQVFGTIAIPFTVK